MAVRRENDVTFDIPRIRVNYVYIYFYTNVI